MPIGEAVVEGLVMLLRIVLEFVFETLLELPIRFAGIWTLRLFGVRREFDSTPVLVTGVIVWLLLIVAVVRWLVAGDPPAGD